MSNELSVTAETNINWTFKHNQPLSVPTDSARVRVQQGYVNGDGSEQVNEIWRDRRIVSGVSPNDDIDIAGVLTNVFGQTVNFWAIKELLIVNLGTDNDDGTFTPHAGENLKVGGAASNPWTAPFVRSGTASTARMQVESGGVFHLSSPLDGLLVSPGSSDVLRIAHDGVIGAIGYDIVLIGVKP